MQCKLVLVGCFGFFALAFSGCSLFPSDTSRPVMRYPARPVPAIPVPGGQGTETSVTSSPAGGDGTDVVQQMALDKAACEAARGHWNECASPCRNDPDAKVCVMSCMAVCECGGIAGFGCPDSYECTDLVPKNAFDALGICKPMKNPYPTVDGRKVFESEKFVYTSAVVMGQLNGDHIEVVNPFVFFGTTTAFENQFSWRVKDSTGKILANGQAMTSSPDMGQPGAYRIQVILDAMPTGKDGMLEVFDNSPKDGAEQILISVPLVFLGLRTADVSVYFVNQKLAKDQNDCSEVYPVKRTVVATERIEEAAMHALLKGPTDKERAAGYSTALPEGVHQPTMEWGLSTNVIDFDDTLTQGMAGSCRVLAAQAQLEKTMGQACVKTHCLFSVNGGAEQALQP